MNKFAFVSEILHLTNCSIMLTSAIIFNNNQLHILACMLRSYICTNVRNIKCLIFRCLIVIIRLLEQIKKNLTVMRCNTEILILVRLSSPDFIWSLLH
jgi:hypothetical protein